MRVSIERLRTVCRERGNTVTEALARAGVSRNAFYSLARRDTILPRTLRALGASLGVEPEALLTRDDRPAEAMKALLAEVDAIVRRNPGVDRENVRHALLLLRRKPIDRLRLALARAR